MIWITGYTPPDLKVKNSAALANRDSRMPVKPRLMSVIRRGSNGLPFWRGLRESYMAPGKVITIPINMSARPSCGLIMLTRSG